MPPEPVDHRFIRILAEFEEVAHRSVLPSAEAEDVGLRPSSGSNYVVDASTGACECPDHEYW